MLKIFEKIKKSVYNPKISSKDGEKITEWEQDFLEKSAKKHDGDCICPNCEDGFLREGPEGGASQNIRCHTCGQGYNVSPFGIDNIGIDESYANKELLRKAKIKKIKSKL